MHFRSQTRRDDSGYIMMTLLLAMALMIIFAAAIVPSITFDIKRDREEEMIHRGVQYSRAIKAYYKKFNRYPAKIEDLENTNQQRFLRKRYKDPLTGKDFKLLHFGEVKMANGAGIGGGVIPGASTLGANGALTGPGQQPGGLNGPGSTGGLGLTAGFNSNTPPPPPAAGGDPNQPADPSTVQGSPNGTGQTAGTDATSASTQISSGPGAPATAGGQPNAQVFGGAPIVGVASVSKERTIREYDKKKKYDEWQFIYDPTFDRGFLITTPYQPSLQQFGMQGTTNLNGTTGQNGSSTGGFGNSFGNSSTGNQNSPTSPSGSYGSSAPTSNPQPQQQ